MKYPRTVVAVIVFVMMVMSPQTASASQDDCAEMHVGTFWGYWPQTRVGVWLFATPWYALEAGCFMDLRITTDDPDILEFVQLRHGGADCTGSTTEQVHCTGLGEDPASPYYMQLYIRGDRLGTTLVHIYERASGTDEYLRAFVVPDFLFFMPYVNRGGNND